MARRSDSAGALRHRITIRECTATDDGSGGVTQAWSDVTQAWASINPVSARESFFQGQVQGAITHRVRMRYQSGLAFAMRVLYGTRTFQIVGIRNVDEESRWLELDCVEELL